MLMPNRRKQANKKDKRNRHNQVQNWWTLVTNSGNRMLLTCLPVSSVAAVYKFILFLSELSEYKKKNNLLVNLTNIPFLLVKCNEPCGCSPDFVVVQVRLYIALFSVTRELPYDYLRVEKKYFLCACFFYVQAYNVWKIDACKSGMCQSYWEILMARGQESLFPIRTTSNI